MATSIGAPKVSFSSSSLHSLCRKFPIPLPSKTLFANPSLISPQTLKLSTRSHPNSPYRRFSARAGADNGAEPRQFDFDLFTIGAGSGGVRASRFAANYGASVAVCELPFATISSENAGGVGGT